MAIRDHTVSAGPVSGNAAASTPVDGTELGDGDG